MSDVSPKIRASDVFVTRKTTHEVINFCLCRVHFERLSDPSFPESEGAVIKSVEYFWVNKILVDSDRKEIENTLIRMFPEAEITAIISVVPISVIE